jgi:phage portal protein BeeE
MGVDDTSWGSGIEQLAILFVRFGLAPWFKAWEEAIRRTLLEESEWRTLAADFDERELLRGTLKDQSEFFARALGAGGHRGWRGPEAGVGGDAESRSDR